MQHRDLAAGQWASMSFADQMSNIGSEVSRTLRWSQKDNDILADKAFERVLELIDITIDCHYKYSTLKELCRGREAFCEAYLSHNLSELRKASKYYDQFVVIRNKQSS